MADLLLDTGPLVALLHRDDADHAACARVFERFHGTLLTTEPVLTESVYLLRQIPGGSDACIDFFLRGGAALVPQSRTSLARAKSLMTRYRDLPMDFADATLVVLAEETGVRRIFTLDRRGFTVYRTARKQTFEIEPLD